MQEHPNCTPKGGGELFQLIIIFKILTSVPDVIFRTLMFGVVCSYITYEHHTNRDYLSTAIKRQGIIETSRSCKYIRRKLRNIMRRWQNYFTSSSGGNKNYERKAVRIKFVDLIWTNSNKTITKTTSHFSLDLLCYQHVASGRDRETAAKKMRICGQYTTHLVTRWMDRWRGRPRIAKKTQITGLFRYLPYNPSIHPDNSLWFFPLKQ